MERDRLFIPLWDSLRPILLIPTNLLLITSKTQDLNLQSSFIYSCHTLQGTGIIIEHKKGIEPSSLKWQSNIINHYTTSALFLVTGVGFEPTKGFLPTDPKSVRLPICIPGNGDEFTDLCTVRPPLKN